jgi:serine O-acetyltransferase
MIRSKEDLKFFLAADRFAMESPNKSPVLFRDHIWRFLILLRKLEYYGNNRKKSYNLILYKIYSLRKYRLGLKLGFDIPENVFGAGLRINHFGNIVVSKTAKIGMWCDIHQGVNIGSNNSETGVPMVPIIGNNTWIGPGVKIFGDIKIADGVQIAANSVVNKNGERCIG